MARSRTRRHEAGMTLIESSFSVVILAILAVGVFSYLIDAQGTFSTQIRSSRVRAAEIDSFDVFETELAQASLSTLAIDTSDPISDRIRYRVPLTVSGDSVVLGATRIGALSSEEAAAGARDVPGGVLQIRAVVQESGAAVLLREVFDASENLVESEVLCRDLDSVAAGSGHKILSIQKQAPFLTVDLRFGLGHGAAEGHRNSDRIERSKKSFFRVRNL